MALEDYLNQISQNMGQAPRDRRISESFYGLNIVGRNAPIALNTENHGYTFFTRPCMNLSYDNLAVDRLMSNLLMENPDSMQRMIRAYLDPMAHRNDLKCPGVDPLNPFIPLLSNNLISLTGWEDFTLGTFTSTPGVYREAYSYVDDIPYSYGTYDLTGTFRNLTGDPITFMMLVWGWYQGLVYEGRLMPYPELVMLNEIDYNTRIYRLVMDSTRTYVTRIAATGASFPMTAPIGNAFNFTGDGSESPFQTANDQVSISFRCMGFTYYDHILIYEFNDLVEDFNPLMRADNRDRAMQELKPWEKEYFNYRSYPRINPLNMKLEWWTSKADYEQAKAGVIRQSNTSAVEASQ
jgi:hypothetical protein